MFSLIRSAVYPVSQSTNTKPTHDSILISLVLVHFLFFSSMFLILCLIKTSRLLPHFPFPWTLKNRDCSFHECKIKFVLHLLFILYTRTLNMDNIPFIDEETRRACIILRSKKVIEAEFEQGCLTPEPSCILYLFILLALYSQYLAKSLVRI